MERRVVSQAEMEQWPVDRASTGEKCWAETTWGAGPMDGLQRLFYNWNTWPCRIVFKVGAVAPVVRAEAVWRRSRLSIRMKGLKLMAAQGGEVICDAALVTYDQERVAVDFRPSAGPGLYHLYYGAHEAAMFAPSPAWLQVRARDEEPIRAEALRIEARSAIEDFDDMEQIALAGEMEELLRRHPRDHYLVFPEDRDHPIKLQFELPVRWAREGPRREITLPADRHEYRVFQLGLWACRADIPDVQTACTDLRAADGAVISSERVQCLTLESRTKARYVVKPSGPFSVPRGQVRALWFGIDIPEGAPAGRYSGTVTVRPEGQVPADVQLTLQVSPTVVPERGDHDLHRLSRLRWIESDAGLSDEVFPPYTPLRVSADGCDISTWGHTLRLGSFGLPDGLRVNGEDVLSRPAALTGNAGDGTITWRHAACRMTTVEPGFVEWAGDAEGGTVAVHVTGRMEYDGCAVIAVDIRPRTGQLARVEDLTLDIAWRREHAFLASGMGYRGLRRGDRSWRMADRRAQGFGPSLWMGSVRAGMGWATWVPPPPKAEVIAGMAGGHPGDRRDGNPWQDYSRADAATVAEEGDSVVLRLNLGDHLIRQKEPWCIRFALLPTPVKPKDERHWQFRYMHKGGWFWPSGSDTPQSFLQDSCRRLDNVAHELGVKRLNLHDWWGPAFNYAWQWPGPDNLSRLTAEAHRRGLFVKVYNSGRELSSFAPEFWALLYEGTGYKFRDVVDTGPRLWFQDAWRQNHLPDGIPAGWPRCHADRGNEHCVPVSNATRNGNFYLESMRYMTRFFGTDGAYWDGADGPTLGHRELAKRLWVIFRQTNPDAAIDVHHGDALVSSPISDHMLCFPFIDSLWHGEGFDYDRFDPWVWLVEIAALPFDVPSEMLGGDDYLGRGMLFGIWPRHGWYREAEAVPKLWKFFDRFRIQEAHMRGWWEPPNGVTVDRPDTYVTAFCHPDNGVLLAVATWHAPLASWMEMTFDVSLLLDRPLLGLPEGALRAVDILSDEEVDMARPVPLPDVKMGRLLWVTGR